MKNKKVTTLLVVVVIAIWGVVFYKIISSFGSNDDYVVATDKKVKISPESFEESKPYTLLGNYRDPFLGRTFTEQPKTVVTQQQPKPIEVVEPPPPVPEIDWGFIKYLGQINNNGKKIALVTINNRELMIKEGEIIQEVKCIKHFKDSIIISYQGKTKSFKR